MPASSVHEEDILIEQHVWVTKERVMSTSRLKAGNLWVRVLPHVADLTKVEIYPYM